MLRIATRKQTKEEVKDAGDYCIFDLVNQNDGFMFICPHDGCGDKCHIPLQPLGKSSWTWDEAKKTLSPSIQRKDPAHCEHHFSLTAGEWVP